MTEQKLAPAPNTTRPEDTTAPSFPPRPALVRPPEQIAWQAPTDGPKNQPLPPAPAGKQELPRGLTHPVWHVPRQSTAELLKEARDAALEVTLDIDGLRRSPENAAAVRDEAAAGFHAARRNGQDTQWVHYARWSRADHRSQIVDTFAKNAGTLLNQSEQAYQLSTGTPADVQKAIALYSTIALRGRLPNAYSEAPTAQDERLLLSIVSTPWFKAMPEEEKRRIVVSAAINDPHAEREFRGLFTAMLRHPNFQKLDNKQQTMLVGLANDLKSVNLRDLVSLLTTDQPGTALPVLLNRDFTDSPQHGTEPASPGSTLLHNLHTFAQDSTELKAVNGVDFNRKRITLVQELLQECNRFNLVDQSANPTCAATSLEHCAAWNNPAELVRQAAGLFSRTSSPLTEQCDVLVADDDAYHADPSGRTRIERVFQAAYMNLGGRRQHGENWRYNSTNNVFYDLTDPSKTRPGGLNATGTAAIFDSFYGVTHTVVANSGGPEGAKAIVDALTEATKPDLRPRRAILCLDIPSDVAGEKPGGHAVTALGIDHETKFKDRERVSEDRLLFRNPWGPTREHNGTVVHGGIRIDDGQHGLCSVRLSDLRTNAKHAANWAIIEPLHSAR